MTLATSATATDPENIEAEATLAGGYPVTVSVGSPVSGSVDFGTTFTDLWRVCFIFHFEGDLLDPGDHLSITPYGFGFMNVGTTPQQDRTICVERPTHDPIPTYFFDGVESFGIKMETGSVRIAALKVRVINAIPSSPVGYRISSSGTVSVAPGGSTSFTATVSDAGDLTGGPPVVSLTTIDSIPGGSASVVTTSGTPTFSSTINVTTSSTTPAGFYWVVVTARGGGFTRSLNHFVQVTSPPANSPPSVEAGGPYAGDEGAAIALDGTVSDPDGDSLATTWTYAPVSGVDPGATCSFGDASAVDTTISCTDDGVYSVTLTAADGTNAPVSDSAALQVANVAPAAGVTAPIEGSLYAVNTAVNVSAAFSDDGTNDTHLCLLDWDDSSSSSGSVSESNGSGTCSGSHSYAAAGVYTIDVTVTDDDGASSTASVMIVVYDPSGGFVTGGGWITSPAGALTSDPSATGKANFGFVSKYKKGATVPDGQTEFQFHAGGLNFHSSSYQWLVVNQNGCRAQFKGTGTVNGSGTYGFMLWAYDGGCKDEPGADKFRIKIWNGTNETDIVYDNGTAYPEGQPLGGGSIVVHVKK